MRINTLMRAALEAQELAAFVQCGHVTKKKTPFEYLDQCGEFFDGIVKRYEALQAENAQLICDNIKLMGECDEFQTENARLRAKVDRIYEVFDVPPEDDTSCINMVEYWRNLWASWQDNARLRAELELAKGVASEARWVLNKLLVYRRANTLNFQLEKLDDYIGMLEHALDT